MQSMVGKDGQRYSWDGAKWVPQSAPGEDFDFQAGQMLANVPGSAVQLGKDIVTPFLHPIDTAKAIGNLGMGAASKLIPGTQEQEVYADAVGAYIADRYGSVDNFQRSAQNDPAGVLSDIAGLVTGGATLAAKVPKAATVANKVSKVARAVDPVNVAGQAALKTAGRVPGLQAGAESLMASGAKLPIRRSGNAKRVRAQNRKRIRTMLTERIRSGDKGVGKMERLIAVLGERGDDLIEAAGDRAQVRVTAVLDALDEAAAGFDLPLTPGRRGARKKFKQLRDQIIESVVDQEWLDTLDGAIRRASGDELEMLKAARDELLLEAVDATVPATDALAAKRLIGDQLNFDSPRGSVTFNRQQGNEAIRRALMEELNDQIPGFRENNARLSALMDLRDPLYQSSNRVSNRNPLSAINIGLGSQAGANLGGDIGGKIGALAGVGMSSTAQQELALMLQRLVDGGMDPNMVARVAPLMAAQVSKLAGRASQQQELTDKEAAIRGRNARNAR